MWVKFTDTQDVWVWTGEGDTPPHNHVWGWEWDQWGEDLYGVKCTYTYSIPPGPKGSKPRTRQCLATYDLDTVLVVFSAYLAALDRPEGQS